MTRVRMQTADGQERIGLDPTTAGWEYLGFHLLRLEPDAHFELETADREIALIAVSGAGVVEVGGQDFALCRRGVFEEAASLLYVPPGVSASLTASADWTVAIASAPAIGRYPTRLITADEIEVEVRGGGAATRQVNHLLAHPMPAERLIVYEVFVPGGAWAGWPPHCHDGTHGSPYLEETYFFQFDREDGFGFHRNYTDDRSLDEVFTVRDGECVAVPRGFHVTTAAPGSNMWILNFLAGEPTDDGRGRPPFFDPSTTWITDDWEAARMQLPTTPANGR